MALEEALENLETAVREEKSCESSRSLKNNLMRLGAITPPVGFAIAESEEKKILENSIQVNNIHASGRCLGSLLFAPCSLLLMCF